MAHNCASVSGCERHARRLDSAGSIRINAASMEKEHTPMERRAPRWLLVSLALCFVAGVLRAWLVLAPDPLIALANSYDEVRYTACFDLYPERPAEIPPTRNSPEAPYEKYHF